MSARNVWRALGAGLIFAALVAILALLSGDFSDTHARVIGTSVGFSVFAGLAGAGDGVRRRREGATAAIGLGTVVVSGAAFLLLLVAIWSDGADDVWKLWGSAALLALCGSHASLVLGARRRADTPTLDALVAASLATATLETLAGVVAIAGELDFDGGAARAAAVVLVVMLLTTALQPILRRLGDVPVDAQRGEALTMERLAAEVQAAADRIERLDSREAATLRELAGRARR
jgi:FtsH-binding integral membrane protein